MQLGSDVLANGRTGVLVSICRQGSQVVEYGVYLKPWPTWDETWAKGYVPKVQKFKPTEVLVTRQPSVRA